MKKNKAVSQPEIPVKSEPNHSCRGEQKQGHLDCIRLPSRWVYSRSDGGHSQNNKGNKIARPSEESQKEASVDREEEIQLFKTTLEKDPNNLQALIALGNAYFDTDRYQEAIDAYSNALAIDPKNLDVRTDMGIMYRKLEQFDKAIEAFRQASPGQPMHVNSRFNLGIVLKYDKGDFRGAIQAWVEFLKLEPFWILVMRGPSW